MDTMIKKTILILIILFCMDKYFQAPLCRPHISTGNIHEPYEGGFMYIKCDIASCNRVIKIQYEKTASHTSTQWIAVFEGFSKTNFSALNTSEVYSLAYRNDYTAFEFKHILHIGTLTLKDGGSWKCVAYDPSYGRYESETLLIYIYVTPAHKNVTITPMELYLLTNQRHQFTCSIDGINPEPEVLWVVNGAKHHEGVASNILNENGLWSVKNTIRLLFAKAGLNQIMCVMKTKMKQYWVQNNITIDVKASARILHPKEDLVFSFNTSDVFTMHCTGSGYYPDISWEKDGTDVLGNDSRFSILRVCNVSVCESSLTFKPDDPSLMCSYIEEYIGYYTCSITLERPYQSKRTSPIMLVQSTAMQCNMENIKKDINLYLVLALLAICVAVIISVVCKRHNRNKIILPDVLCLKTLRKGGNNQDKGSFKYSKLEETDMSPLGLLQYVPASVSSENIITIGESISAIWTSKVSNFVYIGWRTRPCVTVIDLDNHGYRRTYELPNGTSVENGFAVDDTSHLFNVYHYESDASNKYTLSYVQIDELSTCDRLLTHDSILRLNEQSHASFIFAIDECNIGVYCIYDSDTYMPIVHIFSLSDIRSMSSPLPIERIKLNGLENGSNHDSVCLSVQGYICVSSWVDQKIYVHDRKGNFISAFGCPKNFSGLALPVYLHEPCLIQCCIDNSLVVVCKQSIHRYNKHKKWSYIKQNDNKAVSIAAFTPTRLVCLCAHDNTQIIVFRLHF